MILESAREFLSLLAREIGQNEVRSLLLSLVAWSAAGAAVGFALGFTSYRIFRRSGWYGAVSTSGHWLQRGTGGLVLAACTVLFTGIGIWEGTLRGCEKVVTRTRVGTDLLPAVAGVVADGFAWIDLAMDPGAKFSDAAGQVRIDSFRAGTWELDASRFLGRIDALRSETFRQLLDGFDQEVLKRWPALKGGLTERLLRRTTDTLGTMVLEQKLASELRRHRVDHLHAALRTGLIAEAGRHGEPSTITHPELSRFIHREGILPAILVPTRSLARQQQFIYALAALCICFVPPCVARLCRPRVSPE